MKHWSDKIAKMNACGDAVEWLRTQPDAQTAWDTCERGDWMLWLLGKLSGLPESESHRRLRQTLYLAPAGEETLEEALRRSADIVRECYPEAPEVK